MNVAFRTDATSQIGTGHFIRCLTLAIELQKRAECVRFVCRNLPIYLCEMLSNHGIEHVPINSDISTPASDGLLHSHWLDGGQILDANQTKQALLDKQWDWVIVDHYALDIEWEKVVSRATKKLMVIDDLADREHRCDVLLDQNYYSNMHERYKDNIPSYCKLLLGPSYALLRNEFSILRGSVKPRTGVIKRILVFFGGIDSKNYTALAVEALTKLPVNDLHVDIVVGKKNSYISELQKACDDAGYILHVQTNNMAELMAVADLAVGAGGTAVWERCCLGLPSICFQTADNQAMQIADAAEIGILYGPSRGDDLLETFICHLKALFQNAHLLKMISSNSMSVVDGKGVNRVVSMIVAHNIEIKEADFSDSENIYKWRNHPSIRMVSKNNNEIPWEDHRAWFASVATNVNRQLLIGYLNGNPVGVVRFDKTDEIAEVSIYLVPSIDIKGMGAGLLYSAERWLKAKYKEIKFIHAEVMGDNFRSQQLFRKSSYQIDTILFQKKIG